MSERKSRTSSVNPIARGLATLAAAGGSVLARDPLPLALLWTIGIMPLIIQGRIVRQHVRFICLVLMPIAVGLIVVWGWIVGAPPGLVPASAPAAGIRFAAATSLRLAVLGGIWQLCFLTLPPTALAGTLRIWGIRRDFLLVVLGSFAVIPEMNLRARQVLVARAARGFLRRARWWSKVRQVPGCGAKSFCWAQALLTMPGSVAAAAAKGTAVPSLMNPRLFMLMSF